MTDTDGIESDDALMSHQQKQMDIWQQRKLEIFLCTKRGPCRKGLGTTALHQKIHLIPLNKFLQSVLDIYYMTLDRYKCKLQLDWLVEGNKHE